MYLINRKIKIPIFDVHQLPGRSVGYADSLFRVPPGSTTVRAQFTCVLKRQVTKDKNEKAGRGESCESQIHHGTLHLRQLPGCADLETQAPCFEKPK